jgi:hypothetical protein
MMYSFETEQGPNGVYSIAARSKEAALLDIARGQIMSERPRLKTSSANFGRAVQERLAYLKSAYKFIGRQYPTWSYPRHLNDYEIKLEPAMAQGKYRVSVSLDGNAPMSNKEARFVRDMVKAKLRGGRVDLLPGESPS